MLIPKDGISSPKATRDNPPTTGDSLQTIRGRSPSGYEAFPRYGG